MVEKLIRWWKGGPIERTPADPLSRAAEKMQIAKLEALKQAAYLEQEINRTKADLDAAHQKLTKN